MHDHSTSPQLLSELALPDPGATLAWEVPIWCTEAPRLLVERTIDGRWWPSLDEWRAEVGVVLLLAGMAVSLWWIVRTLRRPREYGRAYCRHCNQALAMGAPAPANCPECGRALGPKHIVLGHRRAWRWAVVVVPMLAMALLGLQLVHDTIAFRPVVVRGAAPIAWPAQALGNIKGWPLWRADRRLELVRRVDVVDITDESQLRWLGAARMQGSDASRWIASPDGGVLAWVRFNESNGWRQEVFWYDIATGATHSVVIGTNADGFITVTGFTADGRGILVRRDGLQPAASLADPTDPSWHPVSIMRVDMESGTWQHIADSAASAAHFVAGPPSSRTIRQGIAAVGEGPRFKWATISFAGELDGPMFQNLIVSDRDGLRRVEIINDLRIKSIPIRSAVASLVDDRTLVIACSTYRVLLHARPRFLIDLESGRVSYQDLSYFQPWMPGKAPIGIASTVDMGVDMQRWAVVDAQPSLPGQMPQPVPGTPVQSFVLQLWRW